MTNSRQLCRLLSVRHAGARVLLLVLAASLLLSVTSVTTASAAPIDDERAKAQQLESSINDTSEQLAALYEQIKFSEDELDQAQHAIIDARDEIAASQAEVDRVVALVRTRAVTIYQQAGDTGLVELQTDVRRAASRRKYAGCHRFVCSAISTR